MNINCCVSGANVYDDVDDDDDDDERLIAA